VLCLLFLPAANLTTLMPHPSWHVPPTTNTYIVVQPSALPRLKLGESNKAAPPDLTFEVGATAPKIKSV
jgi:hypothetical protein